MSLNYLGNLPRVSGSCQSDVILSYIHDKIQYMAGLGPAGTGGLATETTLSSLVSTMQAFVDFEDIIVKDTVTDILYIQERKRNEGTGAITVTYYDVTGSVFVPTNPMEFVGTTAGTTIVPHSGFTATTSVTGSGTVTSGAYSVVIHNTGSTDGIVNGAPLLPGSSRTYTSAVYRSLPAITYDATGTTFYIEKLNY